MINENKGHKMPVTYEFFSNIKMNNALKVLNLLEINPEIATFKDQVFFLLIIEC